MFDAIGEVAEDTSNLVIMMFLILVAKGYTVRAKEQPSVLLRPNRPPTGIRWSHRDAPLPSRIPLRMMPGDAC